MRSKHNLYVYASFFGLVLNSRILHSCFLLEACVESLRLFFIVCLIISLLLRDILI